MSGSKTTGALLGLGVVPPGSDRSVDITEADAVGSIHQGRRDEVEGVYIISVAARILEMHPQTLRKYERVGLVRPSRTVGMLRLYSEEDIARLRLIKHLVGDFGLNLAGVQLMLRVFNRMLQIRASLPRVPAGKLDRFIDESLDELFELIHAHKAEA